MSLSSIIAKIKNVFSASTLTDIEKVISKVSPVIATDLANFMATLPPVFASLETAAGQAITLYKDAKGITISKDIAIAVAQSIFTAKSATIVAEAQTLLKAI